ncbi:MAG: fasciclin domain-containing protein [Paludibacter sp.]|nr:fasciclin domain-containing protein [Paludibacter sp.]
MILVFLGASILVSCKDEYLLDNLMPSWLGSNIYDYLDEKGNYTYTLKLIDDLNYSDVLKRTGSKTLFVASDSAYNEFFKNNEWGVVKYEQLTLAQKKLLLNYTMINNAFLIEQLSSYNSNGSLIEDNAMRRATAESPLDSIPFEKENSLPTTSNWASYKNKGLYLLKDGSSSPLVYFFQSFLDKNAITNEDVSIVTGGLVRQTNDAHVFNCKIIKRDITCQNGYINVLNKVLVPPVNMAQYILSNPKTTIFSKLLERYSTPYFTSAASKLTSDYHQKYPEFNDSLFEKKYFAVNGGVTVLHNGNAVENLLAYDPGWNSYKTASDAQLQSDMAAMFVPSDDAMKDYFNNGVGQLLKDRFGTWDNIPDAIILPLIKRHMRASFIESVPSKFSKMVDVENYTLPVEKNHIVDAYTGVNGVVYTTNTVYPPVDYISVYSPVLLSNDSKIMNWVIKYNTEKAKDGTPFAFYKLYLNSLTAKYSLFIPADRYLTKYIDPIAYGQDVPGVLKFWYDENKATVKASVYKYNKSQDVVGDSIGLITDETFILNRLHDLLDSHIVVGGVETGAGYHITKANDLIKTTGFGNSLIVQGGDDLAKNTEAEVLTNKYYSQANGKTYFINKPIQAALRSTYKALSETPQFSKFFELLNGVPDTCVSQIFTQQGIDSRINFFNAFRYTIYVPTNDAVQTALDQGVVTPWSQIYALGSGKAQGDAISKMIRFLRYHFQDNAVFFGSNVNSVYQSATIKTNNLTTHWGTAKNKYYKIGVEGTSNSLTLTTENNKTAHVETKDGLYNIIVKDYIFNYIPTKFKNIDGTGNATGTDFTSSSIISSSSSVIHQIDNVLTFE